MPRVASKRRRGTPPPAENTIITFVRCRQCIAELPAWVSPREWAQLEVGFTKQGLQVWCRRHEINVMHIDFEGARHPANLKPS